MKSEITISELAKLINVPVYTQEEEEHSLLSLFLFHEWKWDYMILKF